MKLLITGGAGFIGSHFAKISFEKGHKVTIIDNLNSILYASEIKNKRIENLQSIGNFEFIQSDLCDLPKYLGDEEFDAVVNFAALPGQLLSWTEISKYSNANLVGVGSLITNLVLGRQTRFIQISTSSVYGKNAAGNEMSELIPYSPYGVTKKAAEDLIKAFADNFEIDYLIFRPFSVFGPGQRPDMAVHKFLKRIKNGELIELYGNGEQTRSMTSVEQVAKTIGNALETDLSTLSNRIFNLAGDNSVSANELLRICEKVVGKKANVVHVPKPAGDQLVTKGDSTLAKEFLKFDSFTDVEKVIADQFESISRNGA